MDNLGDHALWCAKLGTCTRHIDLRNQFATLCSEVGLRADLEVIPPGVGSRPANVLRHGLGSDSPTAVDFYVVHPLHLSDDQTEVHPGKLVKDAEKYESSLRCATVQAGFRPFVVETQGTLSGQARHMMQHLVCLWVA